MSPVTIQRQCIRLQRFRSLADKVETVFQSRVEPRHQSDRPWPHGLVILDTQGIFPHTIPTLATIKDRGIESHG